MTGLGIKICLVDEELSESVEIERLFRERQWDIILGTNIEEIEGEEYNDEIDVVILDVFNERFQMNQDWLVKQTKSKLIVTVKSDHKAMIDLIINKNISVLAKPINSYLLMLKINNILTKKPKVSISEQINTYIEHNMYRPSLRLSDIGKQFGVSENYVSRLIKERDGCPFRKKLTYTRIEKAKNMIRDTNLPMYIIASECGFKNQQRFCEAFRRVEGTSPTQFKVFENRECKPITELRSDNGS